MSGNEELERLGGKFAAVEAITAARSDGATEEEARDAARLALTRHRLEQERAVE